MKDLCWFPVQPRWTVLDQEFHHFHHLLTAVADGLTKASKDKQSSHHSTNEYFTNTICVKYCTFELCLNLGVTYPLSSAYLIVRLGVNGGASLCALQRLLHLLHLDCQMGLKVPTQRHAGVLGRLPAGENLVITQQRPLVLRVQNLKCANLEAVIAQNRTRESVML